MARELFKGMKSGEPDSNRVKFKPSDERNTCMELFNMYIFLRDDGVRTWDRRDFESVVETLEPVVKGAGSRPESQHIIDSLIGMFQDEQDILLFSRPMYLTAVVQTLYNLNYGWEFKINLRDWPGYKPEYKSVGNYLKGRPERRLILELQGDFYLGGFYAKYCDFNFYGEVGWAGYFAEHCTFNLMPGAEIGEYWANRLQDNILKRLNEKGKWEIIR